MQFTAASYNIHGFIGVDGVHDPERIARVILELEADPVGLQEVDGQDLADEAADPVDQIARATGMRPIRGPTVLREAGHYGNVLLTRRPVPDINLIDLSVEGREPRGAIDVMMDLDGVSVRVIVTHLGLSAFERLTQARLLLDALDGAGNCPKVVLGDINEWLPFGRAMRALRRSLGKSRPHRTFPSRFPLLPLDRIWASPTDAIVSAHAHRTPLARVASDHLPVVATIAL